MTTDLTLTTQEALSLIARLANDHGFRAVIWTPEDVRETIRLSFEADGITREVTDADVEAVTRTTTWRRSLEEYLSTEAHDILISIIEDVFDTNGNRREGK